MDPKPKLEITTGKTLAIIREDDVPNEDSVVVPIHNEPTESQRALLESYGFRWWDDADESY